MSFSRRRFFAIAGATTASVILADPLRKLYAREAQGLPTRGAGYGPLQPDPKGLLELPRGFQYRAFSRTKDLMSDGTPAPSNHDGMAAFEGSQGNTILVRNHELGTSASAPVIATNQYDPACMGGTTTLVVGPNRELVRHYVSLAGTFRNCAGGATPWGSWISCEEDVSTPQTNPRVTKRHGYNFEVPATATGPVTPVPLVAMGRFNHEAIAVDPRTGIIYQTEDRGDSLFYRFLPNRSSVLTEGGVLEALKIQGSGSVNTARGFSIGQRLPVEWVRIDEVDPAQDTVRYEGIAKGAATFARGEGIAYGNGEIYFACTSGGPLGKGQVWRYIPGQTAQEGGYLELFAEPNDASVLENPDNVIVSPFGDVFLCEDGDGSNYVVGVNARGELYPFARNAINDSEVAGVCFSPSGRTMFVNIQNPGITFAIWGPWSTQRG